MYIACSCFIIVLDMFFSIMEIPEQNLYKPDEVARILKVARSNIYGWIDRGEITYLKVCSLIRISRKMVQALVKKSF